MNLLLCCYILFVVARGSHCNHQVYISSLNEVSEPDENIIEVDSVYSKEFSCDVSQINALPPATNIHQLRPTDVRVIGAIGDSITAALFAKVKHLIRVLTLDIHRLEYRGDSWSIGGNKDQTTLPNLIKNYSPDLTGFSVKTGKEGTPNAGYNFAVTSAVAADLLGQAELLVDRVKSDDLDEEWKVITIFIGGNDLCHLCEDPERYSKENLYQHIKATIDKLSELKKVFINLVQTVEISKLATLPSIGCSLVQALIDLIGICRCLDTDLSDEQQGYKEEISKIEELYRSKTPQRDDFVVVVQPFFGITTIPEEDPLSYFSPDCFHFSQKGHMQAAVALWNNMLQPVGSKTEEFIVDQPLICPTPSNPYFYTHNNSHLSSANTLRAAPDKDTTENSPAPGQIGIAGVVIGALLLVAAAVGILLGRVPRI